MRHHPATFAGALLAAFTVLTVIGASSEALAQGVDKAIDTRTKANGESVASQKRVDQLSDQTDVLLAEYRNTIKQIESLRVYNRQMDSLIASQITELESLQNQLDNVELVGRGVTPLMLNMITGLDKFVALDVPFLNAERTERVANLRTLMDRADVTNSEKYRRIMEAYQIENEYGRTIEAYRGNLSQNGVDRQVDFLRVGRIALVYQTLDGIEAGAWDQSAGDWVLLDSSYKPAIKEGLRVARKQAAPEMLRLPLPAASAGGGAS
jgi:hypothetical protein